MAAHSVPDSHVGFWEFNRHNSLALTELADVKESSKLT